ncbi:MAG: hypothetical protein MPJ78_06550 [Hyphomicrobiaceae bacterium]|nr:hypothetical protein [Hyphomicrobiaceae bacterium]
MNSASSLDRLVLLGLAVCVITIYLARCIASAAAIVTSQSIKASTNATATVARVALNGTRIASDAFTRSFRRNWEESAR